MQRFHPGHKFSAKQRTTDVLTADQVDFESFLLSPLLLKGLTDSGFEKPSPIQLKAIPLGRCGLDLIAQAKSGTGKTCVFSVIALENVLIENPSTQVLILAPTREIAVQIKDVITAIGCHMKGLSCQVFIGGLPLDVDKKAVKDCQIAIGSPGRIKNLIENKHLKTDSIRMFILDEADKLLEENFQEQINWIFSTLPANKQMMAFSATYPEYLASHLTKYMREPTFVRLNAADPSLQGIKQFYHVVAFHQLPHKIFQEKVEQLLKLLSRVNFHQCLLFSNYQIRAQGLSSTLCSKGWPATFISGSLTQEKRLQALEKLKSFKCRILISTDLTARGIDAENVNLVVNMDVPRDGETYLHRIGRAGRFGTKGVAVTFVAKGKEQERFREVEKSIGITMEALPDHIPDSLMFCNSLPDGSQQQVKHDTVEVSVLHKITTQSSKDEDVSRIRMTSVGESYASTGKKESKDHKQKDAELRTTHNNCKESVLQENRNLPSQNTNSNGSGIVLYPNNLNKLPESLDAKQCIKCFLKENNLATTDRQGNTLELPSLEEFETDFEEFLAFTNTFKNIGLQEKDSCNCTQGNRKTKEKCTLSKKYDMLSDQVGDEDKFAITVAGNIDEIGPAVVCRDVTADKDGHDHGEDTNDGRIISNGSNIDDNDSGDDDENGVDDDGGSDKSDGRIIGDSSHDDNGSDVGGSNSDADDGIDDGIDDDCDDDDRIDRIDGKVISDGSHDDNGSDVGESNSDDDVDDYDRIDRIDSKVISDGSHDDNGSDVGESNSDADDGIDDDDDDYDRIDSKVISDGSYDNGGSVGKSSSDAADDVSFDNGNSDERKKVRKKENLKKVQSHSLNVIFKRKKDKNYNDMEKNPESDHQASDNSYYTDDFADPDPDPDPDGNSACESDSADNGDVDSYSDSHVDGDGDSGDANCNYANTEEINDNKGNAHYIDDDNDTANDYNIKDSDESELQYECSAYSNNEILYRKKGLYGPGRYYGTSQDSQSNPRTKLKTFAHYHHNKSTAPDYQWKTKYPDAPSHQNSMDHDSGLFPWQHAMHCNPNLMAFQTTSGLFHHSTGIHGYGSAHPANQHMINGTGGIQPATNKHHYARGYLPMNDAAVVQSREMPWRSVWHNAFYKINDAIQQFASLNSHPYYPSN